MESPKVSGTVAIACIYLQSPAYFLLKIQRNLATIYDLVGVRADYITVVEVFKAKMK